MGAQSPSARSETLTRTVRPPARRYSVNMGAVPAAASPQEARNVERFVVVVEIAEWVG